jgi:hypothetical protein
VTVRIVPLPLSISDETKYAAAQGNSSMSWQGIAHGSHSIARNIR